MSSRHDASERFVNRHIGPRENEVSHMLGEMGLGSLEELIAEVVPAGIRTERGLALPDARSEEKALGDIARIGASNQRFRSWLGYGYHDTITPPTCPPPTPRL